jgi:hypothetical protein
VTDRVIRFHRRPRKGLLGGFIAAGILGPAALWQAISNHILTTQKGSGAYYLPLGLRILMGAIGAGLTLMALLCGLMMLVLGPEKTTLTFSADSLVGEAADSDKISVPWDGITAIRLAHQQRENRLELLIHDPDIVALYVDLASMRARTTAEGTWYELPYDLGKRATGQVSAALRELRPGLLQAA